MSKVVKKEVLKILDDRLIYPISDSAWVSPRQVVPKKGGMIVIVNEKKELIPTRAFTGWRVCIDYRRLNDATREDHFPLPFIDQMLERLSRQQFYCFLDGFSGYDRDFLGRCFIKDFSKITLPMTRLLEKDLVFEFNEECIKAFEFLKERLVSSPILIAPNGSLPFELMCDASDFAVGAVLGQGERKTLSFDLLRESYLVLSKTIAYTNHAALRYFFTKKGDESRGVSGGHLRQILHAREASGANLIEDDESQGGVNPGWVTPWEVFTWATKSKAVSYNLAKRTILLVKRGGVLQKDTKPRLIWWILLLSEFDIEIKDKKEAGNVAADHLSRLDDPAREKMNEEMIRDTFPHNTLMSLNIEIVGLVNAVFKDAHEFVRKCDACQRTGNISRKHEMPRTLSRGSRSLIYEVLILWDLFLHPDGIDTSSLLLTRFRTPKALISDRGTHFCNAQLEKVLERYGVTHRVLTTYHPQTSRQV
ncbi:hypothetical protein E3N88_35108 [Mikania micrantha]|uniref:Integrase catalytic domain-containing protein n=1 Tax=Mikania micrantha TaxID=192012 RepID=A0A5N6M066_9ASTR|nr:hypothetical protein E3N88_35108 [Mikania micrantha]